MSLTSILRKEKYRTNVKNWFKYHFPNPGLSKKIEILVVPNQEDSAYAGEVGTAFDYLMRFSLERINKKFLNQSKNWIAEIGLKQIINSIQSSKSKNISIGYYRDKQVDRLKFKEFILSEFQTARTNHTKYFNDGELTLDLIKSAVFLAKLDIKYRTGIIDKDFDIVDSIKIDEIKKLHSIVPWEKFKAKRHCILNPTFGVGSELVRGADSDLVIDNTIIDIKTSKRYSLRREDISQLIGYCLLSIIGGINGQQTPTIKNVGIYFARFGHLWSYALDEYHKSSEYIVLAEEFKRLIKDRTLQLV